MEEIDSMPISETEKKAFEAIKEAVNALYGLNWRVINYNVSEKHFMKNGDILRSLKLELCKGPVTTSG